MAEIRVTYDGQPASTTAQLARLRGVSTATMRKTLSRLGLSPLPESLDDRTPLYLDATVDAAMEARPGRGANLRRHD